MARTTRKAGFFGTLFIGILLTATGIAVTWFFGNHIELQADRSLNTAEIRHINILRQTKVVESFTVESMRQAYLQENRDSDGDRTYKVMIETTDTTIPLTNYNSSGRSGHQKNADQINRFIQDQEPNLTLKISGTLLRIIGITIFCFGILMFFTAGWMLIKLVLALTVLAVSK
jgi:hypothetical protein